MITALLNVLYGCRHKRITRPITPVHKPGVPAEATYVACLECGKQFYYDLNEMRVGKPVPMATISSGVQGFQAQY